jgi:hypothetical protein
MHAERITESVTYHGEGPVWSARWGGLRWVDMLAGDVLSLADDGTVARRHVSDVVAALRPRCGGGAVLGIERGFALADADWSISRLDPLWSDEGVRMNEGRPAHGNQCAREHRQFVAERATRTTPPTATACAGGGAQATASSAGSPRGHSGPRSPQGSADRRPGAPAAPCFPRKTRRPPPTTCRSFAPEKLGTDRSAIVVGEV